MSRGRAEGLRSTSCQLAARSQGAVVDDALAVEDPLLAFAACGGGSLDRRLVRCAGLRRRVAGRLGGRGRRLAFARSGGSGLRGGGFGRRGVEWVIGLIHRA